MTFRALDGFTVGLEEEFSILDPGTLELAPRFEELCGAPRSATRCFTRNNRRADLIGDRDHLRYGSRPARRDRPPARAPPAPFRARRRRRRPGGDRHPSMGGFSRAADHRHRALPARRRGAEYVAWRNNTFSLHVHLGVRELDRAVRVCDRLRPVLPLLLAIRELARSGRSR